MPAATYYHLPEESYTPAFPAAPDPVPVLIDRRTFFDAWIMNRIFNMITNVEQVILENPSYWG